MPRIGRAFTRFASEATRYVQAADRQAIRRELAREAFFRTAERFTPTIEAEWPTGRFLVSTADRDVSRCTFMTGPYGLGTLIRAAQLIERQTGTGMANREVLEIGANIGTTTIPLVTALGASRVYAFEPVAANYRLLRLNVIANDLASRVETHQSAVSDRVGTLHFVASARNAGSSHVASDDEAGHEVPCVTVDDLVSRGVVAGDRLGLVWIDVEGHEASVLAGADSLVAVPTVLEYQPRLHANMDRLNDLIARRRGHVFDLASGAEVSMHTLAERDQTRATDLLLLPQH